MQPSASRDFVSYLPDIVWYLTGNGRDMWCRSPYTFFFTTKEAASAFARASASELELSPIGLASADLLATEALHALRAMAVTRVFIDPQIDPASGDVFGKILRVDAAD